MPDLDLSNTIVAKSDQLNADDLMGGSITVVVERVSRGNADQPVNLHISGGHQPWKPCKTMRRLLILAWGKDGGVWAGRSVTLYRDPEVKWAGEEVGGIRVSHLSHMHGPLKVRLAVSRGKKKLYKVNPIHTPAEPPNLEHILVDASLTVEDFDRWRAGQEKSLFATLNDKQRTEIAKWLSANTTRLDDIRATKEETQ